MQQDKQTSLNNSYGFWNIGAIPSYPVPVLKMIDPAIEAWRLRRLEVCTVAWLVCILKVFSKITCLLSLRTSNPEGAVPSR